jgi:hypothetical protein
MLVVVKFLEIVFAANVADAFFVVEANVRGVVFVVPVGKICVLWQKFCHYA